jgi:major membrane immunogen (membrane-anchored lipoprotein)
VNNTIERISRLRTVAVFALTLLLGVSAAFAQDTVSGTYEGTLKNTGAADEKVSLELKNDGGKISGRMMKGQTAIEIAEGSLAESKLSLKLKDGMINAVVAGDKITGDWASGNKKGSLDLKKVVPAASSTSSASAATPATEVNLNGQWDAVADAQGQPFPFLLVLKIDGENVTGSSSSQLGDSTIKKGSWKDGKLMFDLEGQNGTISMSATIVEGKLSGQFDYAGQLVGKWVAVKKN